MIWWKTHKSEKQTGGFSVQGEERYEWDYKKCWYQRKKSAERTLTGENCHLQFARIYFNDHRTFCVFFICTYRKWIEQYRYKSLDKNFHWMVLAGFDCTDGGWHFGMGYGVPVPPFFYRWAWTWQPSAVVSIPPRCFQVGASGYSHYKFPKECQ